MASFKRFKLVRILPPQFFSNQRSNSNKFKSLEGSFYFNEHLWARRGEDHGGFFCGYHSVLRGAERFSVCVAGITPATGGLNTACC